jgi:4-carboxymuconolactone decarboxylase
VTTLGAPRLVPRRAASLASHERELLRGNLRVADRFLTGGADAPPLPSILGLLAHHPRLGASWLAFNGVLMEDGKLAPRDRELLVLRTAWLTQSDYEWSQHTRIGLECGLTDSEILSIPTDDLGWSERDRALLRAADQLVATYQLDDETWSVLAQEFDEAQLLEILFVVGAYACLAMVMNTVRLDAGADSKPLPRREP